MLAHFAATLQAHVRDSDVVGRLGGDEFGIILSHANKTQAHKKAAVLMERLTESPAMWGRQAAGLSDFPTVRSSFEAAENADAAIARADEAMYRQKRGGK